MIVNRSAPPGPLVPVLVYEDLAQAIDWLCGAFGFTERLRVTDDQGHVGHAQLAVGAGAVILSAASTRQDAGTGESVEYRPPRPNEVIQSVSVHVADVDRHFEQAQRFGARILLFPADHVFGERQYTALDLAGHRWSFTQTIADVAPEAWGATVAGTV